MMEFLGILILSCATIIVSFAIASVVSFYFGDVIVRIVNKITGDE